MPLAFVLGELCGVVESWGRIWWGVVMSCDGSRVGTFWKLRTSGLRKAELVPCASRSFDAPFGDSTRQRTTLVVICQSHASIGLTTVNHVTHYGRPNCVRSCPA